MTTVLLSLMLFACVDSEPAAAPDATKPPVQQPKHKAPPTGKKPGPGKQNSQKAQPDPVGAEGPVEARLVLTPSEGEKTTTLAMMQLIWDGGEAEVKLGNAPGTCVQVEATPVADGVVPLFRVSCENEKAKADLVVLQAGELLMVKRAKLDMEAGEFEQQRAFIDLIQEAALMAQFDHPNILGLIGVCTKGISDGLPLLLIVQYVFLPVPYRAMGGKSNLCT